MLKDRKYGHLLILVIAVTIVVSFFYGKVIVSPNSVMFGMEGDGLKNYYAYAYYIDNNEDIVEFDGMNYPYGDHFIYTDGHPIQAFVLRQLAHVFPNTANYSIGILNIFLLLSFYLTALFLYLLFIELDIDRWFSALSALAILVLSPQIFRLTGHLSLSYSFCLPLIFYLLIIIEKRNRKRHLLMLLGVLIYFFFTHPYLGMMSSMVVAIHALSGFLSKVFVKTSRNEVWKYIKLGLTGCAAVAIFYSSVKITDEHVGRTTEPWGLHEHHGEISSVLLPDFGPLKSFRNHFFENDRGPWEAKAYIGLVALLGILIFIGFLIGRRKISNHPRSDSFLRNILITGLFTLCFALLMPFRKHIFNLAEDYTFIKQFRSIGRFAWVFFFAANIIAVAVFHRFIVVLKAKSKKVFSFLIIFLIPLFIFLEGIKFHEQVSRNIGESKNLFSLKQHSEEFKNDLKNIETDKYQAIIAAPFFHIGSENFGKHYPNDIYKHSFLFSYFAKLPMINTMLARTSIPESKYSMQLLGTGYYPKQIENEITSDKPFLLVAKKDNLSYWDQKLISKAKEIVVREGYSLYELTKSELFSNPSKKALETYTNKKDRLFNKNGFLVTDTAKFFLFNNFETGETPSFDGAQKCYSGAQKNYNVLLELNGAELDTTKKYITRFWMYNAGENYGQDALNGLIFFSKKKGDKDTWLEPYETGRKSHEINGDWSQIEITLSDVDIDASYKLCIKGNDRSKLKYYVDDLLFYEKDLEIYKEVFTTDSTYLYYNNHRIPM